MAYKDKAKATRYKNEFARDAYDRINLTLPKGEKQAIKAAADAAGESLNAFINKAIRQRMDDMLGKK